MIIPQWVLILSGIFGVIFGVWLIKNKESDWFETYTGAWCVLGGILILMLGTIFYQYAIGG